MLQLNDPILQTCVVGVFLAMVGATMALYLWTERRTDTYLILWAVAWLGSGVRWALHYVALWSAPARMVEGGLFAVVLTLQAMGCYELVPHRPWSRKRLFLPIVLFQILAAVYAGLNRAQIGVGYTLLVANCLFGVWCIWQAYRSHPLSGYVIGIAAHAWHATYVAWGLWIFGPLFTNHVTVPMIFNTLMILSIVMIAYQLRRIQLQESEETLNQIFETAPSPILITRPPSGEIERLNRVAAEMLGVPKEKAIGHTAAQLGVVADITAREQMYRELEAGQRVQGREVPLNRRGNQRIIAINASKITLRVGPRYILSTFDVTDLRRAESELHAAAEEMRQLYMRLGTVEDEERRALQRDLHDLMGANLAALRLEIDLIGVLLSHDDRAGAVSHVENARQVVVEMIAMVRNLMAELRPPALDEYGLVAALRSYSQMQGPRLHLAIRFKGEDIEPRLDAFVEGALFRIAQEAITNAAKHAHAREVAVNIEQSPEQVRLAVRDDGTGFTPGTVTGSEISWGLKNMRKRAKAIGATLSLESEPNSGTCVIVSVSRNGT